MLEEKTKVNFEYFIAGFGVLLVLFVFFGIFAGFITNMIGFIYPGYMTLLALDGNHEGIQTNWLIYWALYSVLTLVEDYGEFIIYWIPFYYPAKAAFLIYMMVMVLLMVGKSNWVSKEAFQIVHHIRMERR